MFYIESVFTGKSYFFGEKYLHTDENTFLRGAIISTAVQILQPQFKYFYCGANIFTAEQIFFHGKNYFLDNKYHFLGKMISFVKNIFPRSIIFCVINVAAIVKKEFTSLKCNFLLINQLTLL